MTKDIKIKESQNKKSWKLYTFIFHFTQKSLAKSETKQKSFIHRGIYIFSCIWFRIFIFIFSETDEKVLMKNILFEISFPFDNDYDSHLPTICEEKRQHKHVSLWGDGRFLPELTLLNNDKMIQLERKKIINFIYKIEFTSTSQNLYIMM